MAAIKPFFARVALAIAAVAAAAHAAAQLPFDAPKAAVSSDGFIRVVAYDNPRDEVGFRLPILAFAGKTIDSLSRTYGVKRVRVSEPGLVIYAMDGRTNDTRVIVRTDETKDGGRTVKIFLPSPGYSDLDELRAGIARAFLGIDLPDWVVQGLLRSDDDHTRREDERFVLKLWSEARLPFFPALCTDLRVAKGRAASLAGYIGGWIREKKIIGKLSEGKWDGRRLAELLTGEKDPVMQDRASDERLARLARSVLEPGKCGTWELDHFSSRMFLYSPLHKAKLWKGGYACDFRDAIGEGVASNLLVRASAFLKTREIPVYALGRGDAMQEVSTAYVKFLLSLAAGEERGKLERMLGEAEGKLEREYEKNGKDHNGQR